MIRKMVFALLLLVISGPLFADDIFLTPQNQHLVNRFVRNSVARGEQAINIKLSPGDYVIRRPWVLFAPQAHLTIEPAATSGRVRIIHGMSFGKFTKDAGHYRGNQACIYPLAKRFEIKGTIEFDWMSPLWIQYRRFIDLSAPIWVAKEHLAESQFARLTVVRNNKQFVEVPFDFYRIGSETSRLRVYDSTNWNKPRHKRTYTVTGKKLSDRWFCVANHSSGGGELRFQNIHIESDSTEVEGGFGIFEKARFLDCSVTGSQNTTGAPFGSLFRLGNAKVEIGLFEVSRCYVAKGFTRFSAIGHDGNDRVDVVVKKVVMTDNTWALDPACQDNVTFLRLKVRSQVPIITFTNNKLDFSRCRNPKTIAKMLSITEHDSLKMGQVFESKTKIVGEDSVSNFIQWSNRKFYSIFED